MKIYLSFITLTTNNPYITPEVSSHLLGWPLGPELGPNFVCLYISQQSVRMILLEINQITLLFKAYHTTPNKSQSRY